MALFTARDRIAIAVLAVIILTGWSFRLYLHHRQEDTIKIIRGAVQPAVNLNTQPSISIPPSTSSLPDTALSSPLMLDINRADVAELDKLPQIGPAKAKVIIQYRVEHGPFTKIEDIMQVKGIGQGIYARIKNQITVGPNPEKK
jgi:competence protein ComEA